MKRYSFILLLLMGVSLFNLQSAVAQSTEQFYHLGNVAGRQQKYKEAIADYTQSIALSPGYPNPKAYYNRAFVYIKLRKYKLALADLDKAIELNPDYAMAYHVRGIAYFSRKKYDQAVADYSKAIALDPDNMRFYTSRLSAYFKLGEKDKAWKDVINIEKLGGTVNPAIIDMLKVKKYRE